MKMSIGFVALALVMSLMRMPTVASEDQRHVSHAHQTATGPSAYGFALSLSPSSVSVTRGQPIWVTLEVRNVSGGLAIPKANGARLAKSPSCVYPM